MFPIKSLALDVYAEGWSSDRNILILSFEKHRKTINSIPNVYERFNLLPSADGLATEKLVEPVGIGRAEARSPQLFSSGVFSLESFCVWQQPFC